MNDRRRTPGSQSSLREANRSRILAALRHHGALTQVELADVTGLSPATVSNIVKELSSGGVVSVTPSTRSGRRATRVSLAHGSGLVLGVHVSARQLRVVLADLGSTVLSEHRLPLARDHRADAGLDRVALLAVDMLDAVDAGRDDLLAAGIAISAPVDRATGTVARAGIMRGWDHVPIARSLGTRIGTPVVVDNAANLAALAEHRGGAARGTASSITLELSEGIGAGIMLGGQLLRGRHGTAGEFGHTVVDPLGKVCRCGMRGCLEAVAGAPAVLEGMRDGGGTMTLNDLIVRAMSGDTECLRAIADAGRTIGRSVGGLCNVLDPERVVVGGGFARAGELLLGPMRHAMEAALIIEADGTPDLVQGQLGDSAAALGAVALAAEAVGVPLQAVDAPVPR